MDGKIYKITNTVNDKVYIGQTTKTLEERFKAHKSGLINPREKTALKRAMNEYGIGDFTEQTLSSEASLVASGDWSLSSQPFNGKVTPTWGLSPKRGKVKGDLTWTLTSNIDVKK